MGRRRPLGSLGSKVNPTDAGPARLMRRVDGRWTPIGPVLPPIDDPDMHDGRAHERRTAWWHFPVSVGAAGGDRLLCRERAWELLGRCGPNHWAVVSLAQYFGVPISELLGDRDVFSVRPLTRDEVMA